MTTIDQYRYLYGNARDGLTYDNASRAEVLTAVKALMPEDGFKAISPAAWVHAIHNVTLPCRRCAGTGRFITYVENGQPRGPGGICFRCEGKGVQDYKDGHRNRVHDEHAAVQALTGI